MPSIFDDLEEIVIKGTGEPVKKRTSVKPEAKPPTPTPSELKFKVKQTSSASKKAVPMPGKVSAAAAGRSEVIFLDAKCASNRQSFKVRIDLAADGVWNETYGVKPDDSLGQTEIVSEKTVDMRDVRKGPQYACPYCGAVFLMECGACRNLTCFSGDSDTGYCAHCGRTSAIGGQMGGRTGGIGRGQ